MKPKRLRSECTSFWASIWIGIRKKMKHKAIIFGCAILYALTTLVLVTAMTLNVSRTQAATVPQQNMFFHQSFPDIVVAPNTTTGFDQISFTADQKGQALIVIDMNAMLDNYHGSYSPTPITTLFCRLIASSVTRYIVTKTYTWHDSNDESFDLTGTFPVQAGGNSVILNCSVSQALSNTSITLTSGGT